jgi:nucleolar protein 14
MPPSQLKRLKASLREQGVTGPQKSKKQKQQKSSSAATKDRRVARSAAIAGIREQFNPFELKTSARPAKFSFANADKSASNGTVARPGVTRSKGEETRRQTLLKEMQRRKKVGGMVDRRFGENDPTMTPEERALQRFVAEQERGSKKAGGLFDLEDDEEGLTHLGRSLADDFDATGLEDEDEEDSGLRPAKRRRLSDDEDEEDDMDGDAELDGEGRPERKKTKQEVMKEVMAKSKMHKYERQKTKEDDDELRMELDEGLQDIYSLLGTKKKAPPPNPNLQPVGKITQEKAEPQLNPDRAALLEGKDRADADREYDQRLRQLALEQRAAPTTRTKTDEEKAEEEAERLKKLEADRLKRMRGEAVDEVEPEELADNEDMTYGDEHTDALGLGAGIPVQPGPQRVLDVEDEDDFIIDDIVASDSEAEAAEDDDSEGESVSDVEEDDDDREFIADLITEQDAGRTDLDAKQTAKPVVKPSTGTTKSGLAFTYPCPGTHEEWLSIINDVSETDILVVVQRIRALYHPKITNGNKELLANFAGVLVDHISYAVNDSRRPSFKILEQLIRHIHSLAKSFPLEVSNAFRKHLKDMQNRPAGLTNGDLIIFTAIGSIFPTSDHFHQVVTPAMLLMNWYLSQRIPQSLSDLARGFYLCTVDVQYLRLSKRYVPELVNYLLNMIAMIAPKKPQDPFGPYPSHEASESLRIGQSGKVPSSARKLEFDDMEHTKEGTEEDVKAALLEQALNLVSTLSDLWLEKSAFVEIFDCFGHAVSHLKGKSSIKQLPKTTQTVLHKLDETLSQRLAEARRTREPLALHNHRPLAIKTSVPKFEEGFNPDKHYDPDRERAELKKLKAEHKREKKGALRELRKDASFMARESLREKKEKDEAHEKKQRRLIAEIQGEEGKEKNDYERVRRMRKGKK